MVDFTDETSLHPPPLKERGQSCEVATTHLNPFSTSCLVSYRTGGPFATGFNFAREAAFCGAQAAAIGTWNAPVSCGNVPEHLQGQLVVPPAPKSSWESQNFKRAHKASGLFKLYVDHSQVLPSAQMR